MAKINLTSALIESSSISCIKVVITINKLKLLDSIVAEVTDTLSPPSSPFFYLQDIHANYCFLSSEFAFGSLRDCLYLTQSSGQGRRPCPEV